MSSVRGIRASALAGGAAVLALTAMVLDGRACDTPVYRYAMYRWLPAPYEVYYFHEQGLDDEAERVKVAVRSIGEDRDAPANIVFVPVDLSKDAELVGVPPDVKRVWRMQSQATVPSYLISSPRGDHLFTGQLSRQDVAKLCDSPKRQEVARMLEAGKAGVFILVTGVDSDATAAAEQAIRGLSEDIAAGKVALYSAPALRPGAESEADRPATEIGLVTVNRDDEVEKWLLECLRRADRDLLDVAEPMAFMVYGRGRALPPCVGRGIHRDNLIQDVEFITGACSCTVKEQNPGLDLLVRFDWDAAAESLAQRFGAEEGSGYQFGGDSLFPELIIPADSNSWLTGPQESTVPADVAAEPALDQTVGLDPPANGSAPDYAASVDEPRAADSEAVAAAEPALIPDKADEPEQRIAARLPSSGGDPDATSAELVGISVRLSPMQGVIWVGAGLAVTLLLLFGATFFVLRPK